MSLDRTFARIVTHRRPALFGIVALILAVSVAIIVMKMRFASEVLDLLPQHFAAVQAFKTFDKEFSQARELTIGLLDEKGEVDFDGFTEHFSEELRKEPWITRVMDRSPMDSPGGVDGVRTIALPMLLNLPAGDFDEAMKALAPEQISTHLQRLKAELEAGSPKAEFELDFDPLGLVRPALKPLTGSINIEQTRPLASPDGTLRIVLARTNQTDLGAKACQETMQKMEDFKKRVLASWTGPAPQILVTGRTPYVGELSKTMGGDVVSTVVGSVVLVAGVFYAGFRRLRPLMSIMQVLLVCCVIAIAFGTLVFPALNIITVGLCSILIGLGVDFGMMLYAVYEQERESGASHEDAVAAAIRSQGKGVFFGSLTSAAGFLCFLRSQSPGFIQLGVLIAVGVTCAGLFMATLFFALNGERFQTRGNDWLWNTGRNFVGLVYRSPKGFSLAAFLLLAVGSIVAFGPIGHLQFDSNPKSLEPKDSHAGIALRTIQSKMPIAAEPVIVLLHSQGPEDFHQNWERLQTSWKELVTQKRIRSAASPAALAVSPATIDANATRLAKVDLAATRTALTDTLNREGLSAASFKSAFALIDNLQQVAGGDRKSLDWRTTLPQDSSWWFVLDRFFSRDPNLGAAYITPLQTLTNFADKEQLRKDLEATSAPIQISGWSYLLQDLVPWAKGKLTELSAIMVFFNVLVLIFLYRRFFPLFILMMSLALSIGALVASLKLFGIPLNMFNVLAFPLVLGVGVDYGIYVVIAMRQEGDRQRNLATVVKPVLLSGLTTACGFGSLALAANPALTGLGVVCALGVAWCLFATLCFVLPAYAWRGAH